MRTKFWRFAFDEDCLQQIVTANDLVYPDLSRWPQAKNNNPDNVSGAIRDGDFVLLANFDRTTEIGIAHYVGRVTKSDDSRLEVNWKKAVPKWSLGPNSAGGVQQWEKEGVFCFDVEPARRYKLAALTAKLFR
ncbi:hypothetical protein GCM10011352_04840 [Marinobacterium zhoushanense]|uniref:Uncharacterized protein n=1 Tax=Marinobacterium zhoushanense TaxID=1679163 RepID=A0ABQ1JZU0_9GAMM|nr:hypothetical protein [Marinobacterium zhoushanense]GGB82068.1 hypothetical protein GCM10011352_04840 [Marinobacterium zhoushanense]